MSPSKKEDSTGETIVEVRHECHALTFANSKDCGLKENRTSVRGRTTVIGANGAATRAGMRVALAAAGVRVSAEVESVQELMLAVSKRSPEVCLIDVDLSGNGLAATAELAVRAPSVS